MWAAGLGAAAGSVAGIVEGFINRHHSAKEARAADKRAYAYWTSQQLKGPKLMRKGYEDAGYNPMLALNGGSASMPSTHQGSPSNFGDIAGSAAAMGEFAQKVANKEAEARAKNINADTAVKDAQAAELRARERNTDASTNLINTQDTATQVGIGTGVANAVGNAANVGLTAYSAKAQRDIMKQMIKPKQGAPVNVKPSVPAPAPSPSAVGNSAKNSSRMLEALSGLGLLGPAALIGAGLGTLEGKNKAREMKRGDHWDPKNKNNRKEKSRKKWHLYHDIGF